MIRVLFFARLREQLDCEGLELESVPSTATVGDIRALLRDKGDVWRDALGAENIVLAVNHEQVDEDYPVGPGDELAFFPPVTGG